MPWHGLRRLLALGRLDPLDLLRDAGVDILLETREGTKAEEDLEVHEERREDDGCEERTGAHEHRTVLDATLSPIKSGSRMGERKYENGEDRTRDGRTTEEVVEERGGTALGDEVPGELREPGDDVGDGRDLDAAGLVCV